MTAGQRIAALRKTRGLSLRQLGKLSGVDHAFISRIEDGSTRATTLTLQKLLRALGQRGAVKVKTVLCFGGEELEMKP